MTRQEAEEFLERNPRIKACLPQIISMAFADKLECAYWPSLAETEADAMVNIVAIGRAMCGQGAK